MFSHWREVTESLLLVSVEMPAWLVVQMGYICLFLKQIAKIAVPIFIFNNPFMWQRDFGFPNRIENHRSAMNSSSCDIESMHFVWNILCLLCEVCCQVQSPNMIIDAAERP